MPRCGTKPFNRKSRTRSASRGAPSITKPSATARSAARTYGLTFWSPNINIFRDPRWGRGQETYGEDPFLTSRLGVAFVRGLQGDDPHYLLAAACAKHFDVHSGPEPLRHDFNVDPSEADFHETYLPAFEALVREGHVEAVMMAYNSVYGNPCSINPRLYDLLYNQWHFQGHVTSDCWSINDLFEHYERATNMAEAEALAIKAGLCLRCGNEPSELAAAVKQGLLPEDVLDLQLERLLRTQFRLGFFDPPEKVPYTSIPFSENNSPAHAALALKAARESIVLLKNDGILPLAPAKLKRVAVIGPNADSEPALLGNYNGTPTAPVTILAGLHAALAAKHVDVEYVWGCDYVAPPPGPTPIPRANLRAGDASGLRGELFRNPDLAGDPAFTFPFGPLSLDWTNNRRAEGAYSLRWTGDIVAKVPGDYEITLRAHGGFRLFVDDKSVVDAWTETGDGERSFKRHLDTGTTLPIRIEYRHTDGPGKFALLWIGPAADAGFPAAVAAARKADAVVFVGGISADLEGEEMPVNYEGFAGGDRTRIELPALQEKLLHELRATGKPLIYVNLSGSAIAMPWLDQNANAIVQAWYPGQAGGTAVADVLLGNTNPAGRLPVTFYRSTDDLPPFDDYAMTNRTYRYFTGKPLYPFGHGLSYTTFSYANLHAMPSDDGADVAVVVSVDVTNSGKRDGDEVVQLYAQEPPEAHPRAQESLCGFRRVHLAAGQTRTVTIIVPKTALRRWDTSESRYWIPAGEWHMRAGASSSDIRQSVALTWKGRQPTIPGELAPARKPMR